MIRAQHNKLSPCPLRSKRRGHGGVPWAAFVGVSVLLCLAVGCNHDESISKGYGERLGPNRGDSVCGTAVLAEMFEHRGHNASSWAYLSPRIDESQTIVWFPNKFSGPDQDVRERLEQWLAAGKRRTLIYVGRDFDAPTVYWNKVLAQKPAPPPVKNAEMKSRQTDVVTAAAVRRETLDAAEECEWFSIDRTKKAKKITTLSDSPWFRSSTSSITPADLEIELDHRLIPHSTDSPGIENGYRREDLLTSGGEPLVTRLRRGQGGNGWGNSQLLIVQNGSFLLNLSLVNHEHRRLAGKLIDEVESCGGEEQQVLFLESGVGGPEIRASDPQSKLPIGPLHEPPVSYIVYHLIVLGILAIFACWPIFGRPRELPSAARSDFSEHIRSLGGMLQRSGDETYCRTRLLHYEQTSRGESHSEEPQNE